MRGDEGSVPEVDVSWEFSTPDTPPAPAGPVRRAGELVAGRFRLEAWLGAGAMGVVYRAEDLEVGRPVALKLWRGDPSRFAREGELTAGLVHPGIVRIHQAGEDQGQAYLVYELVEGARTLDEVLDEADRPERLRLLRDVAAAVGYAHDQGVVHRDLKPANVLVDAAGRVRVADFGLAWGQGALDLTRSGAAVGTPRTMAPEQLKGGDEGRSPRVDVWALGVMLYAALVDALPYPGGSLGELRAALEGPAPAAPRTIDATIPAAVEAVCLRALARRPEQRYPDAGALCAALDAALAGEPAPGVSPAGLRAAAAAVIALVALVAWAVTAPGPEPVTRVDAWAEVQAREQRGELAPALAACRAFRATHPRDSEALALEVRLLLEQGLATEAAATLEDEERLLPPPYLATLRADLAAAAGDDPGPALEAAVARWPDAAPPRLALARRALATRADALTAERALEPLSADPEAEALRAAARALIRGLPVGLVAPQRASREALAGAALVRGRRAAALARWRADPRTRPSPGALTAEAWRQRARAWFEQALALTSQPAARTEAWLGLAADLEPGDPQRVAWLAQALPLAPGRTRALRAADRLAAGDAEGALADLDAAAAAGAREGSGGAGAERPPGELSSGLEDDDAPARLVRGRACLALERWDVAVAALTPLAGDQAVACDLLARAHDGRGAVAAAWATRRHAALLRGQLRGQAQARHHAMRLLKPPRDAQPRWCAELLALDPLLHEAAFVESRLRAVVDPGQGLRDTVRVVSRCPQLLAAFFRMVFSVSAASQASALVQTRSLLEFALESGQHGDTLEGLVHALALVVAVEYEGRRDLLSAGLAELDALVTRAPGQPLAWLLRAILALRAGQHAEARRDLGVARDALGEDPCVTFHEGALEAALGAPQEQVRDLLQRAVRADYEVWGEDWWRPDLYPGLERFVGKPGFGMLSPH